MTTEMNLRFALNIDLPDNATAAWGCRAIARGYDPLDILGDRQDCDGPDTDVLLERLNGGILKQIKDNVDELRNCYWEYPDKWAPQHKIVDGPYMRPDEAEDFVVYQDDEVIAVANTNRSHGYVYVTAFYVNPIGVEGTPEHTAAYGEEEVAVDMAETPRQMVDRLSKRELDDVITGRTRLTNNNTVNLAVWNAAIDRENEER